MYPKYAYKLETSHNKTKYNKNTDTFYEHGLTLILTWISNYIHYNVWDEIISPFPNFNDETVEVW